MDVSASIAASTSLPLAIESGSSVTWSRLEVKVGGVSLCVARLPGRYGSASSMGCVVETLDPTQG